MKMRRQCFVTLPTHCSDTLFTHAQHDMSRLQGMNKSSAQYIINDSSIPDVSETVHVTPSRRCWVAPAAGDKLRFLFTGRAYQNIFYVNI
jgi:hypothetical protein